MTSRIVQFAILAAPYYERVNRRALKALAAAMAIVAHQSCAARPLRIGLVFENDWRVGRETLTIPEQGVVKAAALQALQRAFRGFDVTAHEGRNADRLVIVDSGFVAGFRRRSYLFQAISH